MFIFWEKLQLNNFLSKSTDLLLTFVKEFFTVKMANVDISSTTYLPPLINVVWECPLRDASMKDSFLKISSIFFSYLRLTMENFSTSLFNLSYSVLFFYKLFVSKTYLVIFSQFFQRPIRTRTVFLLILFTFSIWLYYF